MQILSGHRRSSRNAPGFTFVEVLVAMVFVAIVVPVAVEGLLVAGKAGMVAQRKRIATQLADQVLTEAVVTDDWRYGDTEGDFAEDWPGYRWEILDETWDEEGILQLTAVVTFQVKGKDYEVRLSTLVPESEETDESTTTTATL